MKSIHSCLRSGCGKKMFNDNDDNDDNYDRHPTHDISSQVRKKERMSTVRP